jgi:endo-beta-N-acetylglucosaminidase D
VQREQDFVDSRYGGDSEAFMGDVDAGVYSGLKAEEEAAAKAQARERRNEPGQ